MTNLTKQNATEKIGFLQETLDMAVRLGMRDIAAYPISTTFTVKLHAQQKAIVDDSGLKLQTGDVAVGDVYN